MKKVKWLIVAILLAYVSNMKATDLSGELALCTASCYADWVQGKIFCNVLFGEERTQCLQNNDAGYEACVALCHIRFPLDPHE